MADWAFFCDTIISNNCSYRKIPLYISFVEAGGISTNKAMAKTHKKERLAVLQKLFPQFISDYVECDRLKKDLQLYQNSRLIQLIKKLQKSKFYIILSKWKVKKTY